MGGVLCSESIRKFGSHIDDGILFFSVLDLTKTRTGKNSVCASVKKHLGQRRSKFLSSG